MSSEVLRCIHRFVAIAAIFSLSNQSLAEDVTAEEFVSRCVEALGGTANWQKISTLEISGRYHSFGFVRPFTLRRKRPDLYRLDASEGKRGLVLAYDGERAWWSTEIALVSGASWPVPALAPHASSIESEALFDFPISQFQGDGVEVVFKGPTELELDQFLLLESTLPNGTVEQWYFDPESHLPEVRVSAGAYQGLPWKQRTYFSDYREVEGIVLPYYVEIDLGNDNSRFEVTEVNVNVALEAEEFRMPRPSGMELLDSLRGKWDVTVESPGRPAIGLPPTTSQTTSVIQSRLDGTLLEEELSYSASQFPHDVKRQYSYDRFRDLYRISHFGNFTSHLDILEGGAEELRIVVSNTDTGTPYQVYGNTYHTRETIYEIGQDGFKIDRERSSDGGGTWTLDLRLTYARSALD